MSVLIEVAESLKDALNAADWSIPFSATRANAGPRYSREQLRDLQVTVVPKSKKKIPQQSTRTKTMYAVEVYIGLQRGLSSDCNEETDPLVQLGEDIQDAYQNGAVLTDIGASCVEAVFGVDGDSPFLNVQDQNEFLKYTGALVLTFMVLR